MTGKRMTGRRMTGRKMAGKKMAGSPKAALGPRLQYWGLNNYQYYFRVPDIVIIIVQYTSNPILIIIIRLLY